MDPRGPFRFSHLKETTQGQSSYEDFEAIELYCPKCGKAMPVVKSLLLILPEGDKYEYRCQSCSTSVGDKIDRHGQYHSILKMQSKKGRVYRGQGLAITNNDALKVSLEPYFIDKGPRRQ